MLTHAVENKYVLTCDDKQARVTENIFYLIFTNKQYIYFFVIPIDKLVNRFIVHF